MLESMQRTAFFEVLKTEHSGEDRQDHTVEDVSKHDSKEEWEGNTRENGRIHFLVQRHTICVDDFLEWPNEVIRFNESRRDSPFPQRGLNSF
jgi:hypothetical protein